MDPRLQSGTPTRALSVSILTASVRGAICLNDVSSRAGNVGSAGLCGPDNEKLSLAVQHALGEWLPTPPAEQLVEASPCPLPTAPQPMPQFVFLSEESEAESSTVASTSPSDSSEFEPDEEEAVSSSGATDVPTRAHTRAQVCTKRKRKGKGKVDPRVRVVYKILVAEMPKLSKQELVKYAREEKRGSRRIQRPSSHGCGASNSDAMQLAT